MPDDVLFIRHKDAAAAAPKKALYTVSPSVNQTASLDLRCRIDAPDGFVPKARYALESLLRPLSARPVWTSPSEADADLYYGVHAADSRAAVTFPLDPRTIRYFDARQPYDPSDAVPGGGVPVLFGSKEHPDVIASTFFSAKNST